MSESINNNDNRAAIRWKLLASASALALSAAISSSGIARAEDADHSLVWIELGGQYALHDDGQQRYAPPFATLLPIALPSPLPAQRLPGASLDWNGKVSFEPDGSSWVFSADVRYGRSATSGRVEKVLPPTYIPSSYGFAPGRNYVLSKARESETHAILDFAVGKDVGLGMFGGNSALSGGVRIAQFTSSLRASTNAVPDYHAGGHPHDLYKGTAQASHSFRGIGPAISWDASAPLAGNAQDGELTLDWGVNAALLFGRRKVDIHHQTSKTRIAFYGSHLGGYTTSGSPRRSHMATVPNLGGFVGLSMRYPNAKVSVGYRADEFFGAKDGGFASARNTNLGFFGPYASISVGLGD